eukprot:198592_1
MPSLHYNRKLHGKQRRERTKIKRKIQQYLIVFALVASLLVSLCGPIKRTFGAHSNSRHLLATNDADDANDGFYINSLNEFPPLLFSLENILKGAWLLNFVGMFYCFLGIGVVCDCYFVPAIEVIVEKLQMSEDTAGATWMAAGGSAPELFTSFVGTFVAESDVGFGTIVGSAVFNVLFVIGMCAVFTSGQLKLQWFPFARDMTYYLFSLGFLALFFGGISKHQMYWWECAVLLGLYLLYVLIMTQNEKLKAWVYTHFVYTDQEKERLLTKKEEEASYDANISMQIHRPDAQTDDLKTNSSEAGSVSNGHTNGVSNGHTPTPRKPSEDNDDDDDDEDEGLDMSFPDGCCERIWYIMKAPLQFPIYLTLVDVSKEKNEDWWPWTFVGSLIWLGGLSYLMVWWAVVVGYALSIPQEIMGLVFLAAGTSVPELFSCIIVAKKGQADMAVSASIGSNIFDVLV